MGLIVPMHRYGQRHVNVFIRLLSIRYVSGEFAKKLYANVILTVHIYIQCFDPNCLQKFLTRMT